MAISIDGTLFYANWCGHCTNFKPEWAKFKQKVSQIGGVYNGKNISFHEYEDSKLPPDGAKIQNKNIRGYPSIKITVSTNGKSVEYEYEGKRKADDLFYHITEQAHKNL